MASSAAHERDGEALHGGARLPARHAGDEPHKLEARRFRFAPQIGLAVAIAPLRAERMGFALHALHGEKEKPAWRKPRRRAPEDGPEIAQINQRVGGKNE